jgi:hypothetical protein
MNAPNAVTVRLADGPLAGQRLTVHPTRGGMMPGEILPHAPMPLDHYGEPGPRHNYRLAIDGQYRHCAAKCPCSLDAPAD